MRIICPIDLSEASLNAINYAANLVRERKGSLHLLHIEPEMAVMHNEDLISEETMAAKEQITEEIKQICLETKQEFGIDCDFSVQTADLDEIVDIAKQERGDLLVMGTNGATRLENFFFGTHTSNIVDHCDLPVLAIPFDWYDTRINKVVYASDYHKGDAETLMELVLFARNFANQVTVLHVSHSGLPADPSMIQDYRHTIFKQFGHEIDLEFEQIKAEDPEEGLRQYLLSRNIDLLAMVTHHRGFFESMFHDSLSKRMTLLAQVPVLVFHQ